MTHDHAVLPPRETPDPLVWSVALHHVRPDHRNPSALMYANTKELPAPLRVALNAIGYTCRDIELRVATECDIGGAGGDGFRAFACAVNLQTGQHQIRRGSWGGPNPWSTGNVIDTVDRLAPVPPDGAWIIGTEGGSRPTWAFVVIHPTNTMPLLQGPPTLTSRQQLVLDVIASIKSSYRDEEIKSRWRRVLAKESGGSEYDQRVTRQEVDQVVQELVDHGLVTRNKVGAVMITTAGRNARSPHPY